MNKVLLIIFLFSSLTLSGCSFSGVNNYDIVGNDKDKHGCIGSAGYVWCEELKECIRPWEKECKSMNNNIENITENGNVKSEGIDINLKTKNIDMIYSILELINVDLDADFGDILPNKFDWNTDDGIKKIDSYQMFVENTININLNDVKKCFLNHGWSLNLMNTSDGIKKSVEGFEKDNVVCYILWKARNIFEVEDNNKKVGSDIFVDCGIFDK